MALEPPQVMASLFNLLHSGNTFGRILPDLCFLLLLSLCFFCFSFLFVLFSFFVSFFFFLFEREIVQAGEERQRIEKVLTGTVLRVGPNSRLNPTTLGI